MGAPAARAADMHVCPAATGSVPHVGGPIIPGGNTSVLIDNLPAAVLGDSCICIGPPDSLVKGSSSVFIEGKPAVRVGDSTAHGGSVVLGSATVLIGG